jgi:hypothetical protein
VMNNGNINYFGLGYPEEKNDVDSGYLRSK